MGTLAGAIRDAAYLEGDFVLRSGKRSSYYLDKYRFGTRPDLLGPLGAAIAAAVDECEPEAVRIAAPELGAVSLAAAASLAGGLPFVIVRNEAKAYGTANRIEGAFEEGELVCLVEDVVTSGGAAISAIEALREAGLRVCQAVCVVDREEGGADALARAAVRLRPLFRGSEIAGARLKSGTGEGRSAGARLKSGTGEGRSAGARPKSGTGEGRSAGARPKSGSGEKAAPGPG